MPEWLYCRAGDADNYHKFDDIEEVIEYLSGEGFYGPVGWQYSPLGYGDGNSYGINSPSHNGWNYVSLYWGTDVDTATRPITDEEFSLLNSEFSHDHSHEV